MTENHFQHDDTRAITAAVAGVVHDDRDAPAALWAAGLGDD